MRGCIVHGALAALLTGCGSAPPDVAQAESQPDAGTIAGVVRDAASGAPLSFARVEAVEWKTRDRKVAQGVTGADGSYRLDALPRGTYLIDNRYADHRLRYFAVPVEVGDTTALDAVIDTRAADSSATYEYVDIAANPVLTQPPPEPPRLQAGALLTGGIQGKVRDVSSDEFLEGAVIAATTPGLRNTREAISGEGGGYALRSLPPGTYTLSVYYHLVERGNIEVRRTGVEVEAGEITVIDLNLDAKTDE